MKTSSSKLMWPSCVMNMDFLNFVQISVNGCGGGGGGKDGGGGGGDHQRAAEIMWIF